MITINNDDMVLIVRGQLGRGQTAGYILLPVMYSQRASHRPGPIPRLVLIYIYFVVRFSYDYCFGILCFFFFLCSLA